MELCTPIIRPSSPHPMFVDHLAIPARKDFPQQQEWLISRPMVIGLVSGAALTLCIANLITFLINLSVVAVIAVLFVRPDMLKIVNVDAVMGVVRSTISNHELKSISTDLTPKQLPAPIEEYHPFQSELDTIEEVVEDFTQQEETITYLQQEIHLEETLTAIPGGVLLEKTHITMEFIQEILEEYTPAVLHQGVLQEEEEFDVEWHREFDELEEKGLEAFTAEDYIYEIEGDRESCFDEDRGRRM